MTVTRTYVHMSYSENVQESYGMLHSIRALHQQLLSVRKDTEKLLVQTDRVTNISPFYTRVHCRNTQETCGLVLLWNQEVKARIDTS